jgi:hypothetical protein
VSRQLSLRKCNTELLLVLVLEPALVLVLVLKGAISAALTVKHSMQNCWHALCTAYSMPCCSIAQLCPVLSAA